MTIYFWIFLAVLIAILIIFIVLLSNQEYYRKTQKIILEKLHMRLSKNYDSNNYIPPIIPRIYYINLDRSQRRKKYIEAQCEKYEVCDFLTRISAIDGKKLDIRSSSIELSEGMEYKYINWYDDITHGELGCTLSHIKAIYTAYNNGDDMAIIMEDDVSFSLIPHWKTTIEQITQNAPEDWCVITLFSFMKCGSDDNDYTLIIPNKCDGNTTACYLINRKGMENAINKVLSKGYIEISTDESGVKGPADFFIYQICGKSYIYNTPLFYPYNININSDIGNEISYIIMETIESLKPYRE